MIYFPEYPHTNDQDGAVRKNGGDHEERAEYGAVPAGLQGIDLSNDTSASGHHTGSDQSFFQEVTARIVLANVIHGTR